MKRFPVILIFLGLLSLGVGAQDCLLTWNRQGVVLYPPFGNHLMYEPSVIAVSSPVVLTNLSAAAGMYHSTAAPGISYAESADGLEWAEYNNGASVISNCVRPFAIKESSVVHVYCSPNDTQIDEYTSSNGVDFTLAHAAVISGNMGGWNTNGINNNSSGIILSGTFYFFVEQYPIGIGLYTSTDFHTFTPVSLVIPGLYQGPSKPFLINGTWWMWIGANLGTTHQFGIQRWTAPAVTGPWINSEVGFDFLPQTTDEGVGTLYAEVIDPDVFEFGGRVFLLYTANQGTSSIPQQHQVIKLAVANAPMSSVVQSFGGSGLTSTGIFGLTWSYETNALNFNNTVIQNFGGIAGSSPNVVTLLTLENTDITSNDTRGMGLNFAGHDTVNNSKVVASIVARIDQINANDGSFHFSTPNGNVLGERVVIGRSSQPLQVFGILEYADNAAAAAAGRTVGAVYRTGDVLKVVH